MIEVVVSCHLPVINWFYLLLWDEATVTSDKCSVIYKLTSESHVVKSGPRLNVSILVQSLIIPYLVVRGVLCIHLILTSKYWTYHILGFKSPGYILQHDWYIVMIFWRAVMPSSARSSSPGRDLAKSWGCWWQCNGSTEIIQRKLYTALRVCMT